MREETSLWRTDVLGESESEKCDFHRILQLILVSDLHMATKAQIARARGLDSFIVELM